MTRPGRELSAALFAELRSVLREIGETEHAASISLEGVNFASDDLPSLLASVRALRESCASCTRLYERATDLLVRQETLWNAGRPPV